MIDRTHINLKAMVIPMKMLNDFILSERDTIIQALIKINKNTTGTVVVVDEAHKLLGTLTDGDIRRALINNVSLNSSVEKIYHKKCIFFHEDYDKKQAGQAFNQYIKIIPIINSDRVIVDILEKKDFPSEYEPKTNAVLIMAGGLGTRLRPLTQHLPKPMLKVGDKPILQLIIERLKRFGFSNILLSVNYKSDVIENYFMDGAAFGVSIRYIRENKRMGTAGSITLAENYLNEPFIVMNGDILTNLDFNHLLEFHQKNGFYMTVCSRSYEIQVPYGVLNIDNENIVSLDEKPIFRYVVSGGIYVLDPATIKSIPRDEYYDIPQLIDSLLGKRQKVGNFPILDYWMDIGKIEDYHEANKDIKNQFERLTYV